MSAIPPSSHLLPGDRIRMPNSSTTGKVVRWYVQRGAPGSGERDERVCEIHVDGRGPCTFSEAFARLVIRLPASA